MDCLNWRQRLALVSKAEEQVACQENKQDHDYQRWPLSPKPILLALSAAKRRRK
jgi:hypothetical protein